MVCHFILTLMKKYDILRLKIYIYASIFLLLYFINVKYNTTINKNISCISFSWEHSFDVFFD